MAQSLHIIEATLTARALSRLLTAWATGARMAHWILESTFTLIDWWDLLGRAGLPLPEVLRLGQGSP